MSHPGSGQSLSTPMTNISWHSPSATDSTPSHGAPLAIPTHQQNSKFSLTRHALTPECEATSSIDDVLMKSSSVEDHLKEIDHVLNQLTTSGAKIALHKGQWCKTKVNYVRLLVGRNGIESQSNRAQAIQSIKTPTNISELRSFLGVCNYSRQFIENFTDIAQPLTSLLKMDEHFVWTKAQETAMSQLKQCLRSAPCLAYPDPGK